MASQEATNGVLPLTCLANSKRVGITYIRKLSFINLSKVLIVFVSKMI